ncbi:LysR family transcriptional regulator [Kitasatospora saccharophila]|uniref:LysR family transcriptional regulator n=1 Tax=Kitasatospora saccharophila TaxID=407973 RepID=A0ABN2XVC1_9ACTN
MELRQLECFVAVAEENSFTRAAARMHVVQSAVSATIAALERELGAPLLERTSRRVRLTEAGRAFLEPARAALVAARLARDAVGTATGTIGGTLRLGTMSSLAGLDLPRLLGAFHRRHPDVEVRLALAADGSPGLLRALDHGRLDAAFVSPTGPPPHGLRLEPVASTRLLLAVPGDHRLARRTSVPIRDLAREAFVDFPAGYGNRALTDGAFKAVGLDRQVAIEITNVEDGADYVRNGLGIALLPESSGHPASGLVHLPVADADLRWTVFLAVPETHPTAAARALRTLAAEHAPVRRGPEPER